MTITFGGHLTLGDVLPMPLAAQLDLDATLGDQIGDVQARITGLLAIQAQPPPSVAALIAALEAALAALQALIADPLPDVSATAAVLADLQAQLAGLNVRLAANVNFANLLAAGVYYYIFAGKTSAVGPELTSILSAGLGGTGGDPEIAGAIVLASDAGAISALQQIFRT